MTDTSLWWVLEDNNHTFICIRNYTDYRHCKNFLVAKARQILGSGAQDQNLSSSLHVPKMKSSKGQMGPSNSFMLCPTAANPQRPTCHSDFVQVGLTEIQQTILFVVSGDELEPAVHSLGVVLTLQYEQKFFKIHFFRCSAELNGGQSSPEAAALRGAALHLNQRAPGWISGSWSTIPARVPALLRARWHWRECSVP